MVSKQEKVQVWGHGEPALAIKARLWNPGLQYCLHVPCFSPFSFTSLSFSPLFIILSAIFIHPVSDIGAESCKNVFGPQPRVWTTFTADSPRRPAQVESAHEPWAGKQVWPCSEPDPWGCGDAEELWLCIVLLWVEMAAYWRCSLSLQWDLLILALTFSNTWDLFYCLAWGLLLSIRMTYFNFYLNASQASGWLLLKDWAPKDLNWPLSLNGRLLFWSK